LVRGKKVAAIVEDKKIKQLIEQQRLEKEYYNKKSILNDFFY
jgi:hypothetical protein